MKAEGKMEKNRKKKPRKQTQKVFNGGTIVKSEGTEKTEKCTYKRGKDVGSIYKQQTNNSQAKRHQELRQRRVKSDRLKRSKESKNCREIILK